MTRERHQPAPEERPTATRGYGPVRTCVGCRRTRPRDELVRLARTPDGVRYDRQRRAPGRGANLCPDPSCIEAASERGAGRLRRALRGAPETEIRAALDTLRREIDDQGPPDTSDRDHIGTTPGTENESEHPERGVTTHPATRGDQAPDEGAVRSSRT